jgi:hypothetical protein
VELVLVLVEIVKLYSVGFFIYPTNHVAIQISWISCFLGCDACVAVEVKFYRTKRRHVHEYNALYSNSSENI